MVSTTTILPHTGLQLCLIATLLHFCCGSPSLHNGVAGYASTPSLPRARHLRPPPLAATKAANENRFLLDDDGSMWVPLGKNATMTQGVEVGDQFGSSLALSADGTTMAVGAVKHNNFRGHVQVFDWDDLTNEWVLKGSEIEGVARSDQSGWAVDLSDDGNTLAVGAQYHDGDDTFQSDNRGHVMVYQWNGMNWTQKGLEIIGEVAGDRSGNAVSLSGDGNTVAVAASHHDGNNTFSGDNRGHVVVYDWDQDNSVWSPRGNPMEGAAEDDESGYSMAMSSDGNNVIIGTPFHDGDGLSVDDDRGHTIVYGWNGNAWIQRGSEIQGEASTDYTGIDVAISADGNTIAVSTINHDSQEGEDDNVGRVMIYGWNGSDWSAKGSGIVGESEALALGYSIDMSSNGNIVAIGAPNYANTKGLVAVYDWTGGFWAKREAVIEGAAEGDYYGLNIALSSEGDIVAVGLVFFDDRRGRVRAFQWEGPIAPSSVPPSTSPTLSQSPSQLFCSTSCDECYIQESCGAFSNCFWDGAAERCKLQVCDECNGCVNQLTCSAFPDCFWESELESCKSFRCNSCDDCLLQSSCSAFPNCFWDVESVSCSSFGSSTNPLSTSGTSAAHISQGFSILPLTMLSAGIAIAVSYP